MHRGVGTADASATAPEAFSCAGHQICSTYSRLYDSGTFTGVHVCRDWTGERRAVSRRARCEETNSSERARVARARILPRLFRINESANERVLQSNTSIGFARVSLASKLCEIYTWRSTVNKPQGKQTLFTCTFLSLALSVHIFLTSSFSSLFLSVPSVILLSTNIIVNFHLFSSDLLILEHTRSSKRINKLCRVRIWMFCCFFPVSWSRFVHSFGKMHWTIFLFTFQNGWIFPLAL